MNSSIFLTGSNGFIGKNIVESELFQSYELFKPIRSELELSDSKAVDAYFNRIKAENKNIDYIIHAANIGVMRNLASSQEHCLYENLLAFRNIFQYRSQVKRFIQLGSGAEYDKPLHKPNVSETDIGEYLPQDAYGLSKFFSGNLIENAHNACNNTVNLRIFGVFGAYEDYTVRFISNAIVQSLRGLPIIVNQNAEFDYVYIKDFLKILDYFVQNQAPYSSYNITSGKPMTLVEIAYIVKELTHNKHDVIVKNPIVNQYYTGTNKRLLEFLPSDFVFTSMSNAIAELIGWYSTQEIN